MYAIYTQGEFLNDFLRSVSQAQTRVWVQAMIIESGHVLKSFISALKQNPNIHQLDIQIQYDWITSRSVHGQTPLIPLFNKEEREYARQLHIRNYHAYKELRSLNATVRTLNAPKLLPLIFPITGRNHTKIYIVDDTSWMGGCNFMDTSFAHIDFMISPQFPQLTRILERHFHQVNKNKPLGNTEITLENGDRFLADNGTHGNSIIYKTALSLIEQAEQEIFFVSQFTPTGAILEALIDKAHAGVKTHVVTCPEDHDHFTKLPHTIPHSLFLNKTRSAKNFFIHHAKQKVHAKVIMVDSKKLIIGSHNYVDTGVYLGTEEIALQSSDQQLASQLHQGILQYIPGMLR